MVTAQYPVRPDFTHDVPEITGYVDPWVVSPGDTADVKVCTHVFRYIGTLSNNAQISSTSPNLKYQLVRLIRGLKEPHAPEPKKEVISHGPSGTLKGRFQASHPGSYAIIDGWTREPLLSKSEGLEVSFYAQPWMLDAEYPQAILSNLNPNEKTGLCILLGTKNDLILWIGTGSRVETLSIPITASRQRWFHTRLTIRNSTVEVDVTYVPSDNEVTPSPTASRSQLTSPAKLDSSKPLLFAATYAAQHEVYNSKPIHFFNGRLDSPRFRALGRVAFDIAKYDFSKGIDTDEIFDVSGSGLDGRLINAPTRAIRGHDYDHKLIGYSWKDATYGFGAIHFHDDDLDDAAWETDFKITLPSDLRSGAYAIEVQDTESNLSDSIVFFVRPKHPRPQARTAFVFATFTYLAYANEHMYDESKPTRISFPEGIQLLASENYYTMERRKDLGLAIYDIHSDGSAVVYSTSTRPILNVRPDYVHWGFQRPREFSADLMMVGFLEELLGDGYDVLTDHDLHLRGAAALSNYDVVITSSHPEYPSMESLNAYEGFAKNGGYLMYTGGNGFYVSPHYPHTFPIPPSPSLPTSAQANQGTPQWRSATNSKMPHRMEVRRADVGARTNELPAGERCHSLNGELGGLWRSLGRAPNLLFGIGSSASGKGPGRPFIPNEAALKDESVAWFWKGLNEESKKLLGTKGLAGGASGDELDRADFAIGTPRNAIVLATSQRHDDHFMLFNEELIFPMIGTLGSTSPLVRSDMVYFDTNGGGAVFSVGSINWNISMAYDGYKNDVATVTENVIREFLGRGERRRCSSCSGASQ